MKKLLLTAITFIICSCITVSASEFEDIIPNVGCSELEEITGYNDLSGLINAIVNGEEANYRNIFEKILALVTKNLRECLKYTSAIIGFAMLSACIKGTEARLSKKSGDVLFLICYCIISAFLLGILKSAVNIASDAADKIMSFVKASVPAYIGFAAAAMPLGGAANLEGIFLIMVNVLSSFAGGFMLSMFLYIGIFYVVNYMSAEIHVLKLIELVRQVMFWILGFLLTVFAGMTSLSGINSSAVSGSGINAVKYTVGHAVPVVGSFLADSSELLFASAKVFKNAFGTAGIIIIFSICLIPALKLFAVGMLLKFAAGLTEPFCDKRISDCTAAVGQTVIHIMICVILVSVMFIFAMAVILLTGMGG